ncbi:uncharacterized protein LOC126890037 [Diabrotica virgifera virgifera]|uniref:SIAH-type domain-containing protein n=1 Tax=Diabrotica virgifera virgifera TaxID=50390 RepID=A0ABM5KX90_DIAVI|nr:uncharacterized protein LOC126890037 [Diabrotica virgifera virgifera]
MAFIIPDSILETLLCSFCHKYLSVKPIKVYPNRLIQCGRCVDNKEQSNHKSGGAESLYGIIAENILFKCVNKFDGCRKLLKYSGVWHHEQVCLEKIHKCPICSEEITSFLMMRHFHSHHKDAILDYPALVFNLNDHLQIPRAYIYQEEDNLFFLYISYSKSENAIKLDFVYMGSYERAKNIYHQFTVSSENKEFDIVLNQKSCTNDIVVVDISRMSNILLIKFKLIDRNQKILTILGITTTAVIKPTPKNDPQGNQIVKYRSELNLQCIICQEYCIFSLSNCPIQTCYIDNHNNYVCYYCYQWFKYNGKSGLYFKRLIPDEIIYIMKFFKWNCSNCCMDIKFPNMTSHEIKCKLGRQFSCPIKNCCKKGTTHQMIEHLKVHNCLAFSSHFKLSLNILSCYVFVNEYIVYLDLSCSGSENSVRTYNIQVELVTKTDNYEKETTMQPYVLIFDTNNELINNLSVYNNEIFVKVIVI